MCGIAGYVGKSSREVLSELQKYVKHRGPDDTGALVRGEAGLAHARLAIIDTSPLGHQPMELPDGSAAIVLNGEIYNYRELRKDLEKRGAKFRSETDTEVLLWLYKFDGENFLQKCTGMFALALYDFRNERLILARDRMGEKPLYWTLQDGTFFFASELGALMQADVVPRRVDTFALAQYLAFDYVPTPLSILEGVFKLDPATMLLYEGGKMRRKVYWELSRVDMQRVPEEKALQQLDEKISKAVERQLVSDVPLGVFLSGGLDSSTVAYYASRARNGIDTFSISFGEPSFDESVYAREVATALDSKHHEHTFTADDALALVPELPDVFSEPVADASVLPTLLLSRFARSSVTAALGGDGADELFAGYPTFQADLPFALFRRMPRPLRTFMRRGVHLIRASEENFSFGYNLKKLVSTDERDVFRRHSKWLGSFERGAQLRLAGPQLPIPSEDSLYRHLAPYVTACDGKNALLWMYARTYLMDQVLVKVDRASMHYALETRAPFLDHSLVEYALSLPYELKYRNGTTKYLLKKLMQEKLPLSIVERKKKGFGVPMTRWLSSSLRSLCEELLSPSMLKHGFFYADEVERLKCEHFEGRQDRRKELWNLMVFQMWYQKWMR